MNANGPTVAPVGADVAAAPCVVACHSESLAAGAVVDVGPLDDIPPGQGRAYAVGGRVIAVFRERDGRLFATDAHCPHRGGPLADGILGDGTVICPLHGWKIELATGRCLGEAGAVRVYEARLVDGHVWLALGSRRRSTECNPTS